jgi:hypothetical protein
MPALRNFKVKIVVDCEDSDPAFVFSENEDSRQLGRFMGTSFKGTKLGRLGHQHLK